MAITQASISRYSIRLKRAGDRSAPQNSITTGRWQPVHTVYGGAHLFRSDTAARLGQIALRTLEEYAPDAQAFANAIGMPRERAELIYRRVAEKLRREPVEDYRLDFEDGYGYRAATEEDGHAESSAREMARGVAQGTVPPYIGVRIKPLHAELHARSIRTLDIFVSRLAKESRGALPPSFAVTLPKVTKLEQIRVLAQVLRELEKRLRLKARTIEIELMIEAPEAIFDARGNCPLRAMLDAADRRCRGAHFGPYDYTAALGVTAAHQSPAHPACNFAREVMQAALAGTGVWLSDGPTNILPVAIHRREKNAALEAAESAENRAAIHRAWRLHYEHIQNSLIAGFYQGWDLHPAQLVTRYAAVYEFFLSGLDTASERLKNFIAKAAQASLAGAVFDDAASGQGLLNYFVRAIQTGAITESEAQQRTGLTPDQLRSGSFAKILSARTHQAGAAHRAATDAL